MSDTIAGILIIVGGIFGVLGALGLIRMPDVLIRMHASTKIGTLFCGLVTIAAAVHFGDWSTSVRAFLIILFLLVTAPIGSHMIGRAAISLGVPLRTSTDDSDLREG